MSATCPQRQGQNLAPVGEQCDCGCGFASLGLGFLICQKWNSVIYLERPW